MFKPAAVPDFTLRMNPRRNCQQVFQLFFDKFVSGETSREFFG
jgi:hypothetical protein